MLFLATLAFQRVELQGTCVAESESVQQSISVPAQTIIRKSGTHEVWSVRGGGGYHLLSLEFSEIDLFLLHLKTVAGALSPHNFAKLQLLN